MPTIKISDLHPTGCELFSDSESYMNELIDLGDVELDVINGASISAVTRRVSLELTRRTLTPACTNFCTLGCG